MGRNSLLLCVVSDALRVTRNAPDDRLPVAPMRMDRLARQLIDAGLAEEAFALAISMLDVDKSEDRLYLSDFAEWLLLPPTRVREMYRAAPAAEELAA